MSEQDAMRDVMRGGNETAVRLERVLGPWESMRPTKTFYSMTIQQFKDEVKPFTDALKRVADLKTSLKQAKAQLTATEFPVRKLINGVVSAVKADREDGGENGPLYAAMGYTPISRRTTGLVRPPQQGPAPGGSSTD